MNIKKGVNVEDVHPEIWFACGVVDALMSTRYLSCTVTSLRDGKHMAGSAHYHGKAVDFETSHVKESLASLVRAISANLRPLGFDVVLEEDHLHVEYNPKTWSEHWIRDV